MKIWDKKYGILDYKGKIVVSSRKVSEVFEKRHDIVLRSIINMINAEDGLSQNFIHRNFALNEYRDTVGRKLPEYLLTRDGFVVLAMGLTGSKALQFKEAYVNKFNEMQDYITALNTARIEFPELTAAIHEVHENPQPYHFSNELDLINKIVTGMTAKQYKEAHNLGDVPSIRPYLSAEELLFIGMLQKTDIGLVLTEPDYQKRKHILEWYYTKLKQKMLTA